MKEKELHLAECVPPLSPFPRYIWIHQASPPDRLDRACYDIWQRTQSLPDGLKPKHRSLFPMTPTETKAENRAEPVNKKEDLTCLVEQEYMNLIMENLFDCFSVESPKKNNYIDEEALEKKSQALRIESMIKSLLFKNIYSPPNILPTNAKKSWSRNRYVKNKLTKQVNCNTDCSKTEGHKLIVQNPVKTAEALGTITTKTIMVSSLKTSNMTATSNLVILRNEHQLQVFANLCSKAQDPRTQEHPVIAPRPRACIYPGMIRPRQPNLLYTPPPSFVVFRAMNPSYFMSFPHPGPSRIFPGQYQFYPVIPQQVAHLFFCLPQVTSLQHKRLPLTYQQGNATKPVVHIRNSSPVASNGSQYRQHAYRFNHTITRTVLNRTYDTSVGNGMKPL